jgi:hypothetical protein
MTGVGQQIQICAVAPQVRNLPVSKGFKRTSGRTGCLERLWSCSRVILHSALGFLAECTASQTREGNLHGVCLFDRILNPPSTALADFPPKGMDCRGGASGRLGIRFANGGGRTRVATCTAADALPCVLQSGRGTWIGFWKSSTRSFSAAIAERIYC